MTRRVPVEHFEQRVRLLRLLLELALDGKRLGRKHRRKARRGCRERRGEIAHRARLEHGALREPHAEGLLDSQRKLRTRQAVDPEVALKLGIERHRGRGAAAQLREHGADDVGELHGPLCSAAAHGR